MAVEMNQDLDLDQDQEEQDGMFLDLLRHAISQFNIACRIGLSPDVIYARSPTFIKEVMSGYMDRPPSTEVQEIIGGGAPQWYVKVQITLVLYLVILFAILQLRTSIGIDHSKCFDNVKMNTGFEFWGFKLHTYVSAREPGSMHQHLYCDAVMQVGALISGTMELSTANIGAGVLAVAMIPNKQALQVAWNIAKACHIPVRNLTECICAKISGPEDAQVTQNQLIFHIVNNEITDSHKGVLSKRMLEGVIRDGEIGGDYKELTERIDPQRTRRLFLE